MSGTQLVRSIAGCTMLSWALAAAGAPQAESTQTPTAKDGFDLEEVIVAAQRKSENLQVVPITITALSADDIRQKNITSPEDFNSTIPGLTTAPAYLARASSSYTLRGQGQVLGGGDPAVATYFNDVPTAAAGPGYFFDLSSIEVLKGPQGTLFGKNSTGGAVLVVPQRPTSEFGGYVDVTGGNYEARRYQAALNIPVVSDVLLVRFALDSNRRDGYTTNPVNGQQYDDTDYKGYRLGVTYKPSDWFENYFLANYSTLDVGGAGIQCLGFQPNPGAYYHDACVAQQANGPRRVNLWLPPEGNYIIARNTAVDNTTTIELTDNITLKNILAFRQFKQKQSYTSFGLPFAGFEIVGSGAWSASYGLTGPSNDTYSDELQLSGHSLQNRLHWTTGLFADRVSPYSKNDHDVAYGIFLGNNYQVVTSLRHSRSRAIYGQGTYDVTDKLKFTAGARYTKDKRDQLSYQYIPALVTCAPGVPFPPFTPASYCNAYAEDTFSAPTWNASLQYQFSPDSMVFLTARRGYKSGGFNGVAPTPAQQAFGPEYVTDFELGAKTDFHFGDVQGRLNTSVYRSQFDHWQERIGLRLQTAVGEQNFALITNVAEGVVRGLEVEATLIPARRIELSAFYAYTDAYFTSNTFQGVDYTATPVADVAKHKTAVTARYLFGLPASVGDASVSATYSYQSEKYSALTALRTQDSPDPFGGTLPSFWTLNVRADWNNVFGRPLDISALVENATDETYLAYYNDGWSGGYNKGIYAPPRMFGVQARWNF